MYFYIIILCILLSSCTIGEKEFPIEDSLLEITTPSNHRIGYAVLENDTNIITAKHVYLERRKVECRVNKKDGARIYLFGEVDESSSSDIVRIQYKKGSPSQTKPLKKGIPRMDQDVFTYIYRFEKGGYVRGKIIALNQDYIAYDSFLSGTFLSGAIITDLVLEKGDSGAPVWSLGGEFLGIVSSVDKEGKKSWVVQ